jgi:hypothetical protein
MPSKLAGGGEEQNRFAQQPSHIAARAGVAFVPGLFGPVASTGGWLLCHGLQDTGVLDRLGWECAFADSRVAGRWAAHVSWCFAVRLAAAGGGRI